MTQEGRRMDVKALFSLSGKVIVATGATGYLCRHFIEACAQAGAAMVAIDRKGTEGRLEALCEESGQRYGVPVSFHVTDIADEEGVKEVVQAVTERSGHIDGLINAAGINIHGHIEDYTIEDYERLMQVNVCGTFAMCKHFGAVMCRAKKGSIVNIASFCGTVINKPPRTMSGYCTSKAAVLHMTRAIAGEYGEHGVRCNSVSPGWLERGMSNVKNFVQLSDPSIFQDSLDHTPMHRVGRPDELVGAVVYLLADASSYTTGIDMVIDGGYQIW